MVVFLWFTSLGYSSMNKNSSALLRQLTTCAKDFTHMTSLYPDNTIRLALLLPSPTHVLKRTELCFSPTWTLSEHLVHPEKPCILHPHQSVSGDMVGLGAGAMESGKTELYLQGGTSFLFFNFWVEIHLKVSIRVWLQHLLLIWHWKLDPNCTSR